MTRQNNWVRTGRIDSRRLCASCESRVLYGDPRPGDTWAARLRLTREQLDLLLCAAAEFIEAGDGSAVEFVDWISGTVLGQPVIRTDHDGAPPRSESGGFARHASYNHRHPFVLPQAELSPKIRKVRV